MSRAPDFDPLAHLHVVLGDHAVDGRADDGALEIQPRLVDLGLRQSDGRVVVDAGSGDQRLGAAGLADGGGLVGDRLGHGRLRRCYGGAGLAKSVLRRGDLVARNRAGGRERLTAGEVGAGSLEVGLGAGQLGARMGDVGRARCRLRGLRVAAGEIAFDLPLGLAELGFCLGQRQPEVGGIDDHQHITPLDRQGVGGRRLDDGA